MPTWHFGAPGPVPWATRAHYTNSVPWTHGLLWPTTSVPGVPSTQYTFHQPRSQPVNILLHPTKRFRAFVQHQQPNDILLVNLTHPLTIYHYTNPGFPWVGFTPPPNHSFAPCIPHSLHSHSGPLTHVHSSYIFLFFVFFTPTLYKLRPPN